MAFRISCAPHRRQEAGICARNLPTGTVWERPPDGGHPGGDGPTHALSLQPPGRWGSWTAGVVGGGLQVDPGRCR